MKALIGTVIILFSSLQAYALGETKVVTKTILKCPAIQTPEDKKNKWRDAYIEIYDGGTQWYIDLMPVFEIEGVYVHGKVACDSFHGTCKGFGNTDKLGTMSSKGTDLILNLNTSWGEELTFVCDLSK